MIDHEICRVPVGPDISKKLYNWEIDTFAITSEGLVLIATLNGLVEIGSTLA